jgi:8-oxo-dGTP pyrophosphatase MutT (NUDIX family)
MVMIATVSSRRGAGGRPGGRIVDVSDSMALPPEMMRRAREFQGPPAPARAAATVVLLRVRDKTEAFDVYVLRRRSTMAFGGVYAFPGGRVDPTDRPETLRADWPDRLGVPEEQARAVVGAAARELFEEAGVLLAGRADEPDHTVGDVSGAEWDIDREAVQQRELTMAALLGRRGLRLRDDLLLPWARWITPEFEPRRFDTWFFVALLPEAQTARDVSGEADRTAWISPADAGGLTMLPPTRTMLDDLGAYRSIEAVVAAASSRNAAAPVMPRIELTDGGGAVLRVPSI